MMTSEIQCRFCGSPLSDTFADLGVSPLANSYLKPDQLLGMEPFYPLHVYVCPSCHLVQLPVFETPEEIFSDYAYFSSYSDSWLAHARHYTEMMVERFGLTARHLVVEIASNDGYLLQYFGERGIPVLGIEPARNVAEAARKKGIPTLAEFFGARQAEILSAGGQQADLLIGNNVLAHVPALTDFVEGLKILLKPEGIITMEFPHLMRLMEENQFDTIYHEHFSYFSFLVVGKIFARYGLTLFDVEELPTHGGSLRIYARHAEDTSKPVGERVKELQEKERKAGFDGMECYRSFGEKVRAAKRSILDFMVRAKREGKSIAGYGAPAKGNTVLNYCGIRTDFIDYTVDRNPYKQNHYLPGSRIPICPPERVRETKPDYLLILPWNLKEEVMEQMACIREWGGRFVTFVPEVNIR
ncbi:MAG: methyltransferase domain-containing protein [Nitrospirales bacterium]|nr:methyltransferase domain-containing protein [Nitrospirales bacterium]